MHYSHFITLLLASSVSAAKFSYYNPEDPAQNHGSSVAMGSCGTQLSSSRPSAAINGAPWGSPNCGHTIAVRNDANGKCMEMPVLDNCAGCGADHVDLTPAAFQPLFGNVGVATGSWWFGSCGSTTPPPQPSQPPAPEPSPEPSPEPMPQQPSPQEPAPQPAPIEEPVSQPEQPAQETVQEPTPAQDVAPEQPSQPSPQVEEPKPQEPTVTQPVATPTPVDQEVEVEIPNAVVETPVAIQPTLVATPIAQQPDTQAGLGTGAIVGIVIGSVAAVAAVAGTIFYTRRRGQVSEQVESQA